MELPRRSRSDRSIQQDGVPEELVDTGIQRLLGNLDEMADSVHGYRLLESPSWRATLGGQPHSQTEPDQLDRSDVWLQIRLPVLPDSRVQPASIPHEKQRTYGRRNVAVE